MSGVNKVILVGHLGKDPDLRHLGDGVAVASFPFATTDYVVKAGQRIEVTEWHNIILWRGLAESAVNNLKKGALAYLEGKCHTRAFDDKAGVKRYTTEVVVDTYVLLGKNNEVKTGDSGDGENTSKTGQI